MHVNDNGQAATFNAKLSLKNITQAPSLGEMGNAEFLTFGLLLPNRDLRFSAYPPNAQHYLQGFYTKLAEAGHFQFLPALVARQKPSLAMSELQSFIESATRIRRTAGNLIAFSLSGALFVSSVASDLEASGQFWSGEMFSLSQTTIFTSEGSIPWPVINMNYGVFMQAQMQHAWAGAQLDASNAIADNATATPSKPQNLSLGSLDASFFYPMELGFKTLRVLMLSAPPELAQKLYPMAFALIFKNLQIYARDLQNLSIENVGLKTWLKQSLNYFLALMIDEQLVQPFGDVQPAQQLIRQMQQLAAQAPAENAMLLEVLAVLDQHVLAKTSLSTAEETLKTIRIEATNKERMDIMRNLATGTGDLAVFTVRSLGKGIGFLCRKVFPSQKPPQRQP